MITAEVICDSISEQGHRLTTMKGRCPKFIWQEFLTHRMFSRNASSSRAIPTTKYIEEVRSDALRAAPIWWGRNQKGMQAAEELEGYPPQFESGYHSPKMEVQIAWSRAAMNAAHEAEQMMKWGAHKQIVNRILEPFCHINFVVTATEWDNFFGLRLHRDAQPEMRALAIAMWEARKASVPTVLGPDSWHLPFITDQDIAGAGWAGINNAAALDGVDETNMLIRVSVARCARVSYESFETGKRSTVEEDLKLYDRLVGAQPMHTSPAEHQSTPDEITGPYHITVPKELTEQEKHERRMPMTLTVQWAHPEQHRNFRGWRMYRAMLSGEAVAPLPEEFR